MLFYRKKEKKIFFCYKEKEKKKFFLTNGFCDQKPE